MQHRVRSESSQFQKFQEVGRIQSSYYKSSITLILNPDKDEEKIIG